MKLRHLPLRLGAGAYILSSGIDKLKADEEAAAGYHGTATGAYPFLADVDPKTFTKALATSEIVLGTTLLVPVLPGVVVATGFTAFSAALVGLYLRTPALRRGPNDLRPSPQGIGISKDVILLGAATSYLIDTLGSATKKAGKKAGRTAKKQAARLTSH